VLHALPISSPWLDHSNYIWRGVQVMKLLIMQFSPTSRYLVSLRSKYSPQHPVVKHPQCMFLCVVSKPQEKCFHSHSICKVTW
jgi:hypothetical protein